MKPEIYFPDNIWKMINNFLGEAYWKNRYELTLLLHVSEFWFGDYTDNSYWSWHKWRHKPENNWYLGFEYKVPKLPDRLKNIHMNPYVISVNPPKINLTSKQLRCLYQHLHDKVHFG